MALLILIPFLLHLFIFYIIRKKLYADEEYTKKILIPNWIVIVFFILSIIPIVSIITFCILTWGIIRCLNDNDFYYKPGKFIAFLTKEH